jgi:hypothetical protein
MSVYKDIIVLNITNLTEGKTFEFFKTIGSTFSEGDYTFSHTLTVLLEKESKNNTLYGVDYSYIWTLNLVKLYRINPTLANQLHDLRIRAIRTFLVQKMILFNFKASAFCPCRQSMKGKAE